MPLTSNIAINLQNYNGEIMNQITRSGGTIIFSKDNVVVASEISEAEYKELVNSPYVDKIDELPLKRYANEGISFTQITNLNLVVAENTNVTNTPPPPPSPTTTGD